MHPHYSQWDENSPYLCRDGSFWRNLSSQILLLVLMWSQIVSCMCVSDIGSSMKPCPKWSQSRTSSSTSLFCRSEGCNWDGRKRTTCASTLPRVPVPFSRGERITPMHLLFWSNPRAPASSWTPPLYTFCLTPVCEAACCKLEYIWCVKFRSHQISQHLRPILKKMELFIQRTIIYTIYTKELLCISSFTTCFVSIERLHVHASVNTSLEENHPDLVICYFCFYSMFLVQPVYSQAHEKYVPFFFKYILFYLLCVSLSLM